MVVDDIADLFSELFLTTDANLHHGLARIGINGWDSSCGMVHIDDRSISRECSEVLFLVLFALFFSCLWFFSSRAFGFILLALLIFLLLIVN